jgi:3-oxoadipate enol-lactonase
MYNARIEAVRKDGMAAIVSGVLARWFTPQALAQPTPMIEHVRATFEAIPAEGYAAACAAVRDMDQREALRQIRAPTLVIAGTEDLATPPGNGRYVADQIPGARYIELPAAHLSNIEATPAFTQALLEFLTRRME